MLLLPGCPGPLVISWQRLPLTHLSVQCHTVHFGLAPAVRRHHQQTAKQPAQTCRARCKLRAAKQLSKSRGRLHVVAAQAAAANVDRGLQVKLGLAASTGKLDLSDCQLREVPAEVSDLVDLEELSLAGNQLHSLPESLGRLSALQRLQLSGNYLTSLPDSIGQLRNLEGLWLHGNLLTELPAAIGELSQLSVLSLAGNRLAALPAQVGGLVALQDLGLAGNLLAHLPPQLSHLGRLTKLSLHGNRLTQLPGELGGLTALRELWLQGNALASLPASLGHLQALEQLSVADNQLAEVPASLSSLTALRSLWLYGNQLTDAPPELLGLPALRDLWLEANPLTPSCISTWLRHLADNRTGRSLKSLGFDSVQVRSAALAVCFREQEWATPCSTAADTTGHGQVSHAEGDLVQQAAAALQVSEVPGNGPGYFKLVPGPPGQAPGGKPQALDGRQGERVLVVAFGSAPGVPNWGGLLKRLAAAAEQPAHACFDVLYVVDAARAWYGGGDGLMDQYSARLLSITRRYSRVLMVGDSMGASAALLFAPLATAVHAFCPQVDLRTSSIRPGQPEDWLAALQHRLLAAVTGSRAQITVYSGNWLHDLDQVNLLPNNDRVRTKVYSVTSHRLALYLDNQQKLLPLIRDSLLQEMGFSSGEIRLHNLV